MARIIRNGWILLGGIVLVGSVWAGVDFGLSALAGGVVAGVNLSWLSRNVDQLLRAAQVEAKRPGTASVLLSSGGRVLLILVIVFAMIQLSFFRPLGVVCGLSVFVLSGMLEAAISAVQK